MTFFDDPARKEELLARSARPASAPPPTRPRKHDTWEGWEDAAVPPDRLGDYLRDLRALLDEFGYDTARPSLYGHFGQGCVHTRIPFELRTADGIAALPRLRGATPPTWWSPTAARCPASTATASPAASCCRRCSATEVVDRVRRGQGALRPGQPDEPRQGRRTRTRSTSTCGWAPTTRPREPTTVLRATPTTTTASASAAPALRRRRQVPRPPQRRQVMCPSLPGHPRGGALHPRPGPAAVRDGSAATVDHRRLALHRGPRRARPVPGLQGLQVRLPGQRRHGHLQGRVPRPPLPGPAAAGGALLDGLAAAVGAPGGHRARRWSTRSRTRRGCRRRSRQLGGIAPAPRAAACSPSERFTDWWRERPAAARRPSPRAGAAVAGHLHQHLPPGRRRGPRSRCWRMPASRSQSRRSRCAAG